jgi:hypothetical protein
MGVESHIVSCILAVNVCFICRSFIGIIPGGGYDFWEGDRR